MKSNEIVVFIFVFILYYYSCSILSGDVYHTIDEMSCLFNTQSSEFRRINYLCYMQPLKNTT